VSHRQRAIKSLLVGRAVAKPNDDDRPHLALLDDGSEQIEKTGVLRHPSRTLASHPCDGLAIVLAALLFHAIGELERSHTWYGQRVDRIPIDAVGQRGSQSQLLKAVAENLGRHGVRVEQTRRTGDRPSPRP